MKYADLKRLVAGSVSPGPCIDWPGSINNVGYGTLGRRLAHRLSWESAFGPVPAGLLVCHTCDNRRCVRLSHLFVGLPAVNTRDMITKGRGVTFRGEAHASARLSDEQVREIRARADRGETRRSIAKSYGCDQSYVTRLVNGMRRTS